MTKVKKIVIIILSLAIVISIGIYNVFVTNVNNISYREEVLASSKIDESFNDFIIAYFSDLHYGNFTYDKQLDLLVEMLNDAGSDVVIFGGDLIDHYSSRGISIEDKEKLINKLSEIEAPFGKFAVLGNHDIDSVEAKDDITAILEESGFIIITNTNVKIYNDKKAYINLIGIDSYCVGNPDIEKSYENVSQDKYNLVVSHAPDIFDDIDFEKSDYVLSAHSHGGQVYIPLINRAYRPFGCEKYFKGKYYKNNVTLDISNGVGTTKYNARLWADSEIVLYKLKSN